MYFQAFPTIIAALILSLSVANGFQSVSVIRTPTSSSISPIITSSARSRWRRRHESTALPVSQTIQDTCTPRVSSSSTSSQSKTTQQVFWDEASSSSYSSSDPNSLTFSGQISQTSRPLVSLQNKDKLIEFFKTPEARNTLFVSDELPIAIHPVPPEIMRDWQVEARRLGAAMPVIMTGDSEPDSASQQQQQQQQQQQTVMQLCSNGISFSGLTVETIVLCGGKLIESSVENNGLPSYELTMIRDRTEAHGPKLLMWIYNQVMSFVSRNQKKGNSSNKTTTSLCRVTLVEKGDGLAIHFESSFQVKAKLPSFLLKVMPVSKTRAEQQGSAAVTKFVQKGVLDSLHRFETAFSKYGG